MGHTHDRAINEQNGWERGNLPPGACPDEDTRCCSRQSSRIHGQDSRRLELRDSSTGWSSGDTLQVIAVCSQGIRMGEAELGGSCGREVHNHALEETCVSYGCLGVEVDSSLKEERNWKTQQPG